MSFLYIFFSSKRKISSVEEKQNYKWFNFFKARLNFRKYYLQKSQLNSSEILLLYIMSNKFDWLIFIKEREYLIYYYSFLSLISI